MANLYKLTKSDLSTMHSTQWAIGVPQTACGVGPMPGSGYLNAYEDANVALFLNPIHAAFVAPRLFRATGTVVYNDANLRVGCKSLTLHEELPIVPPTTHQCIKFAVIATRYVFDYPDWEDWAASWLDENATQEMAKTAIVTTVKRAVYGPVSSHPYNPYATMAAACAVQAAYMPIEQEAVWTAASAVAWAARAATLDLKVIAKQALR